MIGYVERRDIFNFPKKFAFFWKKKSILWNLFDHKSGKIISKICDLIF